MDKSDILAIKEAVKPRPPAEEIEDIEESPPGEVPVEAPAVAEISVPSTMPVIEPPKKIVWRRLRKKERIVALQRRWRLTYPDKEVPEDIEQLSKLIPAGVKPKELQPMLHAMLEDAKAVYYRIFNTTWTKASFNQSTEEAGVKNVLSILPEPTKGELEAALRLRPDE